jgi:hypothetical protein
VAKAVAKLTCAGPGCRKRFEPQRSTARYCSTTCSQRARRGSKGKAPAKKAGAKTTQSAAAKTEAPKRTQSKQTGTSAVDNHKLVVALRQELETAGVDDTFEGQLAIELARRLVNPDSSASSLADKVRAARAAALASKPAPTDDGPPDEPEDDEVTRARTRRKEAREAAGLA